MRICGGCNSDIDLGRYFQCLGRFWHPECFRCIGCEEPIADPEFSVSNNRPYHKNCYKELYHPKCDICKDFIPINAAGLIEYRAHPFWEQRYCPYHEHDGTTRCCSCERMETLDSGYLLLDDDRKLCLECSDSAIKDTHECQPLYLEVQEFYKGLNLEVKEHIPLLLVEAQELNEAMEGEKSGHHYLSSTRGLCLSVEQSVSKILRQPRFGTFRIIDMFTEPYRLIRRCEVTAILVLCGLPRLLTGSILAHEMMHAWLRLNGYFNLSPDVEEGMCQVLAYMWLDFELKAASSPSSLSSAEKKLGEFVKNQIESHSYTVYGEGFREGNTAVAKYGLKRTLDHIRLTGICASCNAEIGYGRYLRCMEFFWHSECFRCHECEQPISEPENCYKRLHHPRCDVCKNFIPINAAGLVEYREHPFWQQKYCPSHELDDTNRCCSCERMEALEARHLELDDGRKLCLLCFGSATMNTLECQPLYHEIQEFCKGLNLEVEQEVPILLVEKQELNEAMEGEKNGHHYLPVTRGLCLSEEQTVSTILRRPRFGNFRIIDMFSEPYRLICRCEVTAILILYGLPRLLTGSILAHEMMHAWLRLNGCFNLSPEVEEGICQVLAQMWQESKIKTCGDSSSVISSTCSPSSSKKDEGFEFEKKLGEFLNHQIESETSPAYGDGFREGKKAVLKYGLKRTLDHIRLTGCFPR